MAPEHGQEGSTLLLHITGNKLACNFMILLSNIFEGVQKKKKPHRHGDGTCPTCRTTVPVKQILENFTW